MSGKTIGEQRVRVEFNVDNNDTVYRFKQKTADLINDLDSIRSDEVSKTYENTPEVKKEVSGEKLRLIALAQTAYEEAAMWAVKAVTA